MYRVRPTLRRLRTTEAESALSMATSEQHLRYNDAAVKRIARYRSRFVYGVYVAQLLAGFIDIERRKNSRFEYISIYIAPAYRRRGLAKSSLELYKKLRPEQTTTIAYVDPVNIASAKTFQTIGNLKNIDKDGMLEFLF